MIAAAVAAMTAGAFADNVCGQDDGPAVKGQVYKFTFSGKTTKGLKAGEGAGGVCGQQGNPDECGPRAAAKLKIKGWVAYCEDPACGTTLLAGTEGATSWAFWTVKPRKGAIADAAIETGILHVIGKKPNKAEMFGTLKGTVSFGGNAEWSLGDGLYFAGLGKYKASKGIYSSISGNFAGSPAAPWYIPSSGNCVEAGYYDCATLAIVCGENTVAFGKWSVKYNKSASKKINKNGRLPKVPSWYSSLVTQEP